MLYFQRGEVYLEGKGTKMVQNVSIIIIIIWIFFKGIIITFLINYFK